MVRMRPYCIGVARPVKMFRRTLDAVFKPRADKLKAVALLTDDKVAAFSTVTTAVAVAVAVAVVVRTAAVVTARAAARTARTAQTAAA